MKYTNSLRWLLIASVSMVFQLQNSHAQMVIAEVKAVYKSKIDGRIIPEQDFQSFKGRHLFHKLIKGENGAKDTILISPPKSLVSRENGLLNHKAPDFSVMDIYGNSYHLEELKGKVMVMNFWFVACPPCIQEIPELNKLVAAYQSNPEVVFLAFAKDTKALVGKFLSHSEFDYSIIPDATEIAKSYGVKAFPTHILIDKKGIIRYSAIGFREGSIDELKTNIQQSLK